MRTMRMKEEEQKEQPVDNECFLADDSNSSFEDYKSELPSHARKNCCFRISYRIVSHPLFNMIIILMILVNIVVLSTDSIYQTKE